MPILTEEAGSFRMPQMIRAKQVFEAPQLSDLEAAIAAEFHKPGIGTAIKPNQRVAIAVGSRGIQNLERIVVFSIQQIRQRGAIPFVIPAMGSHGGATAQGQLEVLSSYGITESRIGAPIVSSMDVVQIGKTASGIPLYFDSGASKADAVIPVARIKPHTDFRGIVESGLCKMLTIGLGNHIGCSRLHKEGFQTFSTLIPEAASVVLKHAPIPFGIAIVENAYDQTAYIEAVPANAFLEREAELLVLAKKNMPRLLMKNIDVLIVERIGKDISGAGMDPNIVGRTTKGPLNGYDGPTIQRIVALDLSEASHGNAIGLGLADFTLNSLVTKIDKTATYANSIASGNPEAARIPISLDTQEEAVTAALVCCTGVDLTSPRIVRIRDTLHLDEVEISSAIAQDTDLDPRLALYG